MCGCVCSPFQITYEALGCAKAVVQGVWHASTLLVISCASMMTLNQIECVKNVAFSRFCETGKAIGLDNALLTSYVLIRHIVIPWNIEMDFSQKPYSGPLLDPFLQKSVELAQSENWFVRQIVARCAFFGFAVASIVAKTIEVAFGLFFAALSIGFLGLVEEFNTLAFTCLKAANLSHVAFGLILTGNPQDAGPLLTALANSVRPSSN